MKTPELILQRINSIRSGIIFNYKDLQIPQELTAATAMSLSRMVMEGKLKKIGKGKFYKPSYTRLGEMRPILDEVAKDFLVKDGKIIGYITGVPAFAQLGLTTQITSDIVIGSNNYRRPLERCGYKISFVRQNNKITEDNIPLLRFLDALQSIKKIPACTPNYAIQILLRKLFSFKREERVTLKKLALNYTASTRALLGAMLETKELDVEELKKTLNPLTKYKLNISERILPNKSNWNII